MKSISKDFSFLNEAHYQSLIDILPVAVYTTDQEGKIIFYNELAAKLWGRSPMLNDPTETKYTGSHKIISALGEPIPNKYCAMAVALKNGISFRNNEIIYEKSDGTRINILENINPIIIDNKIAGAVNIFYDISDKKKAEEKQAMLAAIVHSSDDAIVSKTLEGVITSWNKGAELVFGYKEEECIGKNIKMLIPKDRWNEEDYILSTIRKGKRVKHYQTLRRRKNGSLINVSITVSPIFNINDEVIGASKIARDISKDVLVKQKLEEYNLRLKQVLDYKDEFLSLVSHEIKTPLACASAYAQLLNFDEENENKPYLFEIKKQLHSLNEIIDDLLNLNKMESGKLSYKMEKLDLNEIVQEAVGIQQQLTSTHGIYCIGTDKAFINGDRVRLIQVFNNLISNAVKYSPGADTVDITIQRNVNTINVSVRDYGIGIPEGHKEKIFNKYHRINENDPNISGLGIGLFLVKNVIERHKGKIEATDPKDGKGTNFIVSLPAKG